LPNERDYKNARSLLRGKVTPSMESPEGREMRYENERRRLAASGKTHKTRETLEEVAAREAEARENPPMTPTDFAMDIGLSAAGGGAGGALLKGAGPLAARVGSALGGGAGAAAAGHLRGYPAGRAFMEGLAGEGVGQALEPVTRPLARAAGRGMRTVGEHIPGVRRLFMRDIGAEDALRLLADEGQTLTAGQVTKSDFIVNAEAFLENAVGARGPLIHTQEGAEEASKRLLGAFVDSYSKLDKQAAGHVIRDMFDDRLKAFRSAASKRFKPVDDAIASSGGVGIVDTAPLKAEAQRILDSGAADIRSPGGASATVLATVAELPDRITFERATNLLSSLGAIGRSATDPIPGQGKKIAGQLATTLDKQTQAAADSLSPNLRQQWVEARKFWKEGASEFNDDLLAEIVEKQPEDIVEYLAGTADSVRRTAIERLTKIAAKHGDQAGRAEDFLDPLRGAVLQRLMKESAGSSAVYGRNPVQFVDGTTLRSKVAAFGAENLEPIFGKDAASRLATLSRTLELAQRRAKSSMSHIGLPSVLLIQGASGYGIMTTDQLSAGEKAGAVSMFLLGPRALSWALRDPKMVSLIGKGALEAPGSDTARRITGQILSRIFLAQRMFGSEEVEQETGELSRYDPHNTGNRKPGGTLMVTPQGSNPLRPGMMQSPY
jgi:hypothetical protein